MNRRKLLSVLALTALAAGTARVPAAQAADTLLNVSYDPTRELYKEYDEAFAAYWQEKTGEAVTVEQLVRNRGGHAREVRVGHVGLGGARRHGRGKRGRDRHARGELHDASAR